MPSAVRPIDELFWEAAQLAPGEQRDAYLAHACGDDQALRQRLERLLRVQPKVDGFLEQAFPGPGQLSTLDAPPVEEPGTVIGPYKLLEQIGEGGMGLVYMAEQTQPVRRRVALKVIKPGMDTRQVVVRFEAERQALALMDHPNIARVFDGGTTATGRPYFVMELVRGAPITEFCDQHRLTARQRLALFVPVCQAVQHAHQKGIIHRDLKPSNVLVTWHDTVAEPKVIDFGIAKAVGQALTERTLCTHTGQLVGTPLYMSPEQAGLGGTDVDTRSDVYALGVVLYELLTGTTPFGKKALGRAGYDEMRRIIREEEPPSPSQRLSTLGARACSTVSEQRGMQGRRLARLLRGEMDWIVMKCLEKDRNRRYESASALAADVQRYLNDDAVAAGPPSSRYRLRKFVRRNWRLLATGAILPTVLVSATVVSIWQAVRARAAQEQAEFDRDRAKWAEVYATNNLERAREAEQRAREAQQRAATEAAIARAVNEFLQSDLLRQVNRSPQIDERFGGASDLTVKEALDRAAARIDQRFQDQPLVEAAIRLAIGDAYGSLNLNKLAEPHLEKAVALHRATLGTGHPDTLGSTERLAGNYGMVGRQREAVTLLEDVLDKYERLFGPDHPTTLDALSRLSNACRQAGMYNRAIMLAKQVLEKRMTTLGSAQDATVGVLDLLAGCYLDAGCFEESIAWYERRIKATQDTNNLPLNGYARALQGAGRLEEADCQLRKALELSRRLSDHRAIKNRAVTVLKILGPNLLLQGRYAEAEPLAREALALMENLLPDDWSRFHAMSVVGGALLGQQRYAEAEPFLVQGYEGMKQRETFINAGFKLWLIRAGERLIRFYEATNQPKKAREWREKVKVREPAPASSGVN
jgi:serine/threonine protein kinase